MGLITGLLSFKTNAQDLKEKLNAMIFAQKHRDGAKALITAKEDYAFGMVNSQNNIFEQRNPESKNDNADSVYAFVDGIVLDVPKHRKALEDSGYKIPVASCSAIVAAAYKKWGMDFMSHLEGEFACAVWDDKEKKLILVRDPYGHKPLHYYSDDSMFIFSSEIKGILAAGISREIDLIGLSEFLSLNCIPYPGTIFKNIKQVAPGSMLILSQKEILSQKFFQHKFSIDNSIRLEDAVDLMTDKFRDAVKKRMVSQDTYCFLSGGIDSSALVSFASEISSKPINAINVSFAEEEVNEFESAKIMANHVGAKLHHVVATPDSFFDMLNTLVQHHDSPFTDTSAYPTYYAGELGRQFTDMILTGDGPDQTMGGSGHHVFAVRNNSFKHKSLIKRYLNRIGFNSIALFSKGIEPSIFTKTKRKLYRDSLSAVVSAYDLRSFFPDIIKKRLCSDEIWNIHMKNNPYRHPESWFDAVKGEDDINKYLSADVRFYVPDDLMIKVDRMCMAHNLETLSPFQDIQLAKIVNSLPGKYKINVSPKGEITTKYILKKMCEKRFPKAILEKKKQGFGIPLEKWLRQDGGKFLKENLLDSKSLNRGYFKKRILEKFVNDFIENKNDYFYANGGSIVGLLTLELWHQKYLDKK